MYKSLALIILFLLPTFTISAQDDLLTIRYAVNSAYDRNTELQQLRARLEQKENEWRTATGISSPELSYFKEGIAEGTGQAFDEKRITVSQEIDFPLTISYRLKGIAEEVKAAKLQVQSLERTIKAETKSLYIEVLYALHLQQSRQNQLKLAEELYNAVYTKFEIGMANGIDLTNAQLRLDEAKNDLDQSEWILHQARYGLFYSIGLPVEDQNYSITFADTLIAVDIEISQILSLAAQENHPDFLASQHELNASEYYLKEAKSDVLPNIRLNLYKQDFGSGYNFTGFEVGLKIPIWYPLDQKGKVNMALAREKEISWKQEQIRLRMKKEIEYAWHNYSVSRSIVTRYIESMKNNADQLRNLSLRAYQLGEIDLLNLLNAQQMYLNSEQRYLSALRDYYLQLVSLEKYLEKDLVY